MAGRVHVIPGRVSGGAVVTATNTVAQHIQRNPKRKGLFFQHLSDSAGLRAVLVPGRHTARTASVMRGNLACIRLEDGDSVTVEDTGEWTIMSYTTDTVTVSYLETVE